MDSEKADGRNPEAPWPPGGWAGVGQWNEVPARTRSAVPVWPLLPFVLFIQEFIEIAANTER